MGADSPLGLEPVRKMRLYEMVAERLREFIDVHDLQPGDRLPAEREIATRLGVSRTSVRQALTSLRTVGLVEMRHGTGAYLVRSSEDVILKLALELLGQYESLPAIMEVREALEAQTSRLAARRHSLADLRAMRQALRSMEEATETGGDPTIGDAQFHAAITRAAHNDLLSDLMKQLSDPIANTRRVSLSQPGRFAESLIGHRQIVDAIAAGDEALAASRMLEHLAVVADLSYVIQDQPRSQQSRSPTL